MRTLLVDNYDSFTYNLFHYLAEVNGTEPEVVHNDEGFPGDGGLRDHFDNIVISPGPGRPDRVGDIGRWGEVIKAAEVPLLGVCLGHQAICYFHGGEVGPADQPQHGWVSPVSHGQTELFAGIPSPFEAVRYHSLAVSRIGPGLQATAWTADGMVMAVRHRSLPLWGVQFHPESIATEHGHRLLANFRDLTIAWQRRTGMTGDGPRRPVASPRRAAGPGRDAPAARPQATRVGPGRRGPHRLRVAVRRLAATVSSETLFASLFAGSSYSFWLDSSQTSDQRGRFTVMGEAGGRLARTVTADVWAGTVTACADGRGQTTAGGFFGWLGSALSEAKAAFDEAHLAFDETLPFAFQLGWVGYLGYELKAECGGNLAHRSAHPDAMLVFADRAAVLDHTTGTVYLLALADARDEADAQRWLDRAQQCAATAGASPGEEPRPQPAIGLRARHSREEYLKLIETCKQAITAGESYEICLTNMLAGDGTLDPWAAYRFLRRRSPSPFGAFLRFGDLAVLSTSPERFLSVTADGLVESQPIKGTRRRGHDQREDVVLRRALAESEKDRAENLMIADLVRSDLGRCGEVGSVEVPHLFTVETYATVHQLVSTVRARLRPGLSPVDCVRAAFPGGSMTGAPKVRTMAIIDGLEAGPRGIYSGAIGYFSLSGAVDLSMAIRTAVVCPRGVTYGVGGAITVLSDPAEEYQETVTKATAFLELTGSAFPG